MKKFFILLLTAIVAMVAQAQTCKISANKNNGKVIQISVNLDSLKGQTLVTTINQQTDGNVNVQMAYEDDSTVISREDSSAINAEHIEEVDTTGTVTPNLYANNDTEAPSEEAADSLQNSEPTDSLQNSEPATMVESVLGAFGLGEVGALIGSLTRTNGEPYAEYYAKKITQADTTQYQPVYKKRKWKWLQNYCSYPTLELSGIFGKDFGGDEEEGADDIKEDDYGTTPDNGFNYGGSAKFSQVFIHGHYDENGNFVPNKLNFGWSIGGLFAMDYQKDYGWSYDILAKFGIQGGNGITLGADALIGAGVTPYAIYSTNYTDHRVIMHNQWCFKYGLQAWVSMNYGGNTYTSLFARIVRSVPPKSVYDHPTADHWENQYIDFDQGSWQIGFAVGYKFGDNSDLSNKRLFATVSTGYNLFGVEKSPEVMLDLEKFNNVSPRLDFIYGLGYGMSLGENKLQSMTLNGGWLLKPSSVSKFSYLAKFHAGVGEYMIEKHVADQNRRFDMTHTAVKQLCLKAGVQLGTAYQLGCMSLNASLRCSYHYGFDIEYEGYTVTEEKGLRGFELTPVVGVGINF